MQKQEAIGSHSGQNKDVLFFALDWQRIGQRLFMLWHSLYCCHVTSGQASTDTDNNGHRSRYRTLIAMNYKLQYYCVSVISMQAVDTIIINN